jgi:hypothetical protein
VVYELQEKLTKALEMVQETEKVTDPLTAASKIQHVVQ